MEVGLAPGQHGFFGDRYGLFRARFILRSSDSKRGRLRRFLKRNEPLIPKIAPERRSKSILGPLDRSIGFAEAGMDVCEVVWGHEFALRAIAKPLQYLSCSGRSPAV